jgi:hypothetical protein
MQCRYCGKELALFKRLTGGGEFCSDSHKQSYQEEYNRLALGRLLQAQKKNQTESSAKKTDSPPAAPVAVEEPVLEEPAAVSSVRESAPLETSKLEEFATAEEATPDAAAESHAENDAEPDAEPLEIADFLSDGPPMAAWPEETPFFEPWLEFSSGPAVADWQFRDEASALSTAGLRSLELKPTYASPAEHSVAAANLLPLEFANGHGQPTPPWKVTTMHQLPSTGPVSLEVSPSVIDFASDRSMAGELDFGTSVLVQDSRLLDLPSTGIEFPAEDSGVTLVVTQEDSAAAVDSAPAETDPASSVEEDSPRASLEALSRLHQDLVQQEDAEPVAEAVPEVLPAAPAAAEAEPPPGEPTPGRATEFLDIPIRMFPPAKPAPIASVGLPSQSEPLLPHLKSLPLRPKVAVATGYVPPVPPADPKATASATQTVSPQAASPRSAPGSAAPRASAASKPAPAARPSARIVQPKQPPALAKTPSAVKTSAPVHSEASKPEAKPEAAKPAAKLQPPVQSVASKTSPAAPAAKPPGGKQPAAMGASVKAAAQPSKTALEETAKATAKPAATQAVKETPGEPTQETVPNFGVVQLANSSFAGSLKVKLGIAIALLVVACSTWLGWGGRHKPASSNSAISADGSGPSIIMGEGGWVEGWGGDPSGLHAGRQITIYRPSLKLSDYRIEFQGSIETQSIGWVFRAADPDNYYAMKLMTVSSGLAPKVALFKYLVINGRQTQVGRVPIDLTLRADTVFSIRTDVRGPQFSTYIQGRQVDVWTDDQLKAGGVGFLNEREERGKVKSVSIRYLNGAAK